MGGHQYRSLVCLLPVVSVGRVILFHHSHEGSHAICQSFGTFCFAPDCSERYDPGKAANRGTVDWEGALNTSMVLLRLREKDATGLVSRLGPEDVVLCLVRTDLMRWTVSEYFKVNPGEATDLSLAKNPQFLHYWHGINVTVTPEHFKLTLVGSTAKMLVNRWREKIKILDRLKQAGKRYGILTYEEFLEGGDAYLGNVLAAFRLAPTCSNRSVVLTSQRVHTDFVKDAVLNFEEIYHYFRYADLPTWGSLARHHQDLDF